MRLFLVPLIIWVLANVLADWSIYRILKNRLPGLQWLRIVHIILSVLLLALVVTAISLPMRSGNDSTLLAINWLLFIYLTFYLPKYVFILFDLVARLPQLFNKPRVKWLSSIGLFLAVVLFIGFWWGCLVNRFQIDVNRVEVEIDGLPPAFEGFTIAQFSDFHVGSYGADTTFVHRVVDTINSLHPDAVMFTGDIVNRHSAELTPFTHTLSRLHSPNGVIAILGNHDYGDYHSWHSPAEKRKNMEELYAMFKEMGWRLLLNDTQWIVKGNDSIAVIGVENIGDPPFPVYGSLSKAYPTADDKAVKILLSHNPSHWVDSIRNNDNVNIALTLSGHTHAMQMSAGGWSPAAWRYPTWGGMYVDDFKRHKLYVNIGVGTVGLPMRLGATPEITLITLKSR